MLQVARQTGRNWALTCDCYFNCLMTPCRAPRTRVAIDPTRIFCLAALLTGVRLKADIDNSPRQGHATLVFIATATR
jgi:hypothetical protein